MKKIILLALIFVILSSGCVVSEPVIEEISEPAPVEVQTDSGETILVASSMQLDAPHVYSTAKERCKYKSNQRHDQCN